PAQRGQVQAELGHLLRQRGQFDEAREAYRAWAELTPTDPQPHIALLELANDRGDRDEARRSIEALRQIGGEDGLHYRVARAQDLLRDDDTAGPDDLGDRLDQADRIIGALDAEHPRAAALLR